MKEILKNYIMKNYGFEKFQDIINKNCLQHQYVEEFLNVNFLLNKVNVILLQNELIKITKKFEASGIKSITFKGAVLANVLYDNIYTRIFSDIDIFVFPQYFEKALDVLYNNGYVLRDSNVLSNSHHAALKNGKIVVELHRNILNPFTKIDESYFFSNITEYKIHSNKVMTFNITATLLHLIYHLYMDTWNVSHNSLYVYSNCEMEKANRFLYRAYEIALFSEKYFNEIKWQEIINDIRSQKLRIVFKKMIKDILEIFPEAFPERFVDAVNNLRYTDDKRDVLYKHIIESDLSAEHTDEILSQFIDTKWNEKAEKNILIYNNGQFVLDDILIKDTEIDGKHQLDCVVNVEKDRNNVKLEFKISNDDFCFSDIGDYNTQNSDGVHLIVCGTEKYSYNSIFLFPKTIDGKTVVIPVDVLNEANCEIDGSLIEAAYRATENDYTLTVVLKEKFLRENNLENYFYLGVIISDCSNKTKRRKAELVLSNPHNEWYNPINFAKIEF